MKKKRVIDRLQSLPQLGRGGRPLGLNTVRLEPNGKEKAKIVLFGDTHLGHPCCNIVKAEAMLKFCIQNGVYVLGMGDYLETALKDSLGDVYSQSPRPMQQMETVIDWFRPLVQHKPNLLLGLTQGNHELRVLDRTDFDIVHFIVRILNAEYRPDPPVRYFGWNMHHLIYVGHQSYTMFTTHGSSNSRLPYTKLKAALDCTYITTAEIVAYGHLHGLDSMSAGMFDINKHRKTIESVVRYFILTGSYLEWAHGATESYAARKLMRPSKTGSPALHLSSDRHNVHVSI